MACDNLTEECLVATSVYDSDGDALKIRQSRCPIGPAVDGPAAEAGFRRPVATMAGTSAAVVEQERLNGTGKTTEGAGIDCRLISISDLGNDQHKGRGDQPGLRCSGSV